MKIDLKEIKKGKEGHGLLIENDGYITLTEGKNKTIMESVSNSDDWYCPYPFRVYAVFQKYDVLNANGRIYPRDVLMREVEKYQDVIKDNRASGEGNHPSDTTINMSRISHRIIELHWEGKTLVGEMELNVSHGFVKYGIVTTCGDEAANLLLNGYKIGVSSRAVGSVENKLGKMIVGDDMELVAWDIVTQPSTPQAYIDFEYKGLQPYLESAQNNKSPLNEKISKIKNLLD